MGAVDQRGLRVLVRLGLVRPAGHDLSRARIPSSRSGTNGGLVVRRPQLLAAVETLRPAQQLDAQNAAQIVVHVGQPPCTVRRHGDMVFLIGAGGRAVG